MNIAEYIIKRLEELNINDYFGISNDYNSTFIQTIKNYKNIHWVECTSELNAGYCADGYARIKGYGALITSYGVGELTAINSISGSMAENVPVINIVGLPDSKLIEKKSFIHNNLLEVDYYNYYEMYKHVTGAAAFLTKENAKLEIDRVLKVFVKEKKPVYIAISEDIAKAEIIDKFVSYDWTSDKETLELVANKIAEKINKSTRPVIIGDSLIKRFGAEIEYKEFIAKTGIPVSNFLMGTNLVDMESDNFIGGYFGKNRNPIAEKYINDTDCCIAVGTIYSDLNASGQNLPFEINKQIGIYGTYTYVDGIKYENIKMSELLETLTELTDTKYVDFDKSNIGLKNTVSDDEKLSLSYIDYKIQEFIKENDIVVTETNDIIQSVAQMKLLPSVRIEFQSHYISSGWATAAALGICKAKPNSRVILITEAKSHQSTAIEISNILKNKFKPIIIVINKNEKSNINDKSDDNQNNIEMNYSKFARLFNADVWTTKVKTSSDFDKALKVTQIMNKMCYIEACIEPSEASLIEDNISEKIIMDSMNLTTDSDNNFEYETIVHKVVSGISEESGGCVNG